MLNNSQRIFESTLDFSVSAGALRLLNDPTVSCLVLDDSLELHVSYVAKLFHLDLAQANKGVYEISLVSNYNSNSSIWLQESLFMFLYLQSVSNCNIGTFSKIETLKICNIV